jgi:hypothetical protein
MGTLTPWRNDTDLGISHIWRSEQPSMMDTASTNARDLADGGWEMGFRKRMPDDGPVQESEILEGQSRASQD